jgi:hypothetical protein
MDKAMKEDGLELNRTWKRRIRDRGADFIYFIDLSMLPSDIIKEYPRAVLFGKTLSKEYISTLRAGQTPKHKEVLNVERRMDTLADKLAETLEAEGYKSIARLKSGTAALRAGHGA